jgi:hypothetical protein
VRPTTDTLTIGGSTAPHPRGPAIAHDENGSSQNTSPHPRAGVNHGGGRHFPVLFEHQGCTFHGVSGLHYRAPRKSDSEEYTD